MSEAKHTPGPWSLDAEMPWRMGDTFSDDYHFIESGCGYHDDNKGCGFSLCGFMSAADARLIVAAPDLLAALKAVVGYGSHGETDDGTSVSGIVEAAIAKAEGRE